MDGHGHQSVRCRVCRHLIRANEMGRQRQQVPAPDEGLADRAEQAAAANPRVLEPGVRGEAGRSHEAPLQA
jgi:hypothetical protein